MSWLSWLNQCAHLIPRQKWEELALLSIVCVMALLLIVPTIKKGEKDED